MDLRILEIASNTENNKVLDNFTHHSKNKNPICGDEMEISLMVKNDTVLDMGYQCKSCIYCQAAVSLLSKISINNKKNEINELCDDAKSYFDDNKRIKKSEWIILKELFQKKNFSRKECILLPFKTLKRIVSN